MNRPASDELLDVRMSRRAAVGRLAGAGAGAAVAAAGFGMSRAAAQGAPSLVRSSVYNQEGTPMTDSTPTADNAALTVALVHGAWDNSSGWAGVIPILEAEGHNVIALANPLRSVTVDGNYIASVASAIPGPVLLVGHSYGGAVISQAGSNVPNAVGLVYVAGFVPDEGETGVSILESYPPTEILQILRPTPVFHAGDTAPHDEFTLDRARFHDVFCADLPEETANILAVTQRPLSSLTLGEPFGVPAWKTLPSWAVVATGDLVIGVEAVRGMAERAGATITEVDASHAVMLSQPQAVADVIMTAINTVS